MWFERWNVHLTVAFSSTSPSSYTYRGVLEVPLHDLLPLRGVDGWVAQALSRVVCEGAVEAQRLEQHRGDQLRPNKAPRRANVLVALESLGHVRELILMAVDDELQRSVEEDGLVRSRVRGTQRGHHLEEIHVAQLLGGVVAAAPDLALPVVVRVHEKLVVQHAVDAVEVVEQLLDVVGGRRVVRELPALGVLLAEGLLVLRVVRAGGAKPDGHVGERLVPQGQEDVVVAAIVHHCDRPQSRGLLERLDALHGGRDAEAPQEEGVLAGCHPAEVLLQPQLEGEDAVV